MSRGLRGTCELVFCRARSGIQGKLDLFCPISILPCFAHFLVHSRAPGHPRTMSAAWPASLAARTPVRTSSTSGNPRCFGRRDITKEVSAVHGRNRAPIAEVIMIHAGAMSVTRGRARKTGHRAQPFLKLHLCRNLIERTWPGPSILPGPPLSGSSS